jgi:integrase
MKDGSGEREYRFISEDLDRHGNMRIYFRQPGRAKIRLREIPGTQEFDREYREALAGKLKSAASADRRAAPGTSKWLCERYYESAEFKGLDASTRRVRRRILDKFNWRDGAKPYRLMEMRHVRQRRDELADRPEAANSLVKALRQVFKFAIANDYANRNPAADVPYLRSANPDGFHTWSVEELEQYRAKWPLGTQARLTIDLLGFTGQRRSDIVTFGRQHVRDGLLRFTQFKNRNRQPVKMEIPILPELQASIDAFPARGLTFLETAFGKPFTANGLGNKVRTWCNAAGLPHCSSHGLRKAGACIAAENGATEAQLMAIFGWRSAKQASGYIKQMQRKRLAGESMHMLVPRQNANETVPLFSGDKESGVKTDGKSLKTKGAKA